MERNGVLEKCNKNTVNEPLDKVTQHHTTIDNILPKG